MFSLLWLVQGLVELATALSVAADVSGSDGNAGMILRLSPALLALGLAIVSWIAAPILARLAIGKYETTVAVSGLTREDLYCFGFIFLGLYFALLSVGNVVNWLHYYFMEVAQTSISYSQRPSPNYYGLSHDLITLVAGLFCLFKGKRWAGRLIESGK
jgi:hypothetical protein